MLSTPRALCLVDFPVDTMIFVHIQRTEVINYVFEWAVCDAVVRAGTVSSKARDGIENVGVDEVARI